MSKYLVFVSICLAILVALFSGCRSKDTTLKIAATPVPHVELLEVVKPELENQGINLKIVEVDDYNLPNRLLYEKQVDANFFQHIPFLDEQNARFGYNLVPLVAVHIEPLGVYSKQITSLSDLKEGAVVAIPNDPTNEARALAILEKIGLIKLKANCPGGLATVYDIAENPKHLKLKEVDAAFLPHTLLDVDLAVIPANFALQAHLNPAQDALALESPDSPFVNVVVVRDDDDRPELQKLKQAFMSEKLRQHIREKYKGALIPIN